MNIQMLSDMHAEYADPEVINAGADVVVLAGDIGVGGDGCTRVICNPRGYLLSRGWENSDFDPAMVVKL